MFKEKVNARMDTRRTQDHDISPAGQMELKINIYFFFWWNFFDQKGETNSLVRRLLQKVKNPFLKWDPAILLIGPNNISYMVPDNISYNAYYTWDPTMFRIWDPTILLIQDQTIFLIWYLTIFLTILLIWDLYGTQQYYLYETRKLV